MIKLIANLDEGKGYELDVAQEEVIYITKELRDLKDISKRKTDFSKTFMLPATDKNNIYFGSWFDYGMNSIHFNPNVATHVDLYEDNNLILSGNMQLVKFSRSKKMYEVVVFGLLNTISGILGNKHMSELDFNYLSHEHNLANIELSWDKNLMTGLIVYPISDYGRGYYTLGAKKPDETDGWFPDLDQEPMIFSDLRPAMLMREIVKGLFENNGWLFGKNELDDIYFDDIYIQLHIEEMFEEDSNVILNIDTSYRELIAWEILGAETNIPFTTDGISPYYSNITHEWTAVLPGRYNFEYNIDTEGGQTNQENTLRIRHNGVQIYTLTQSQTISVFAGTLDLVMGVGDTLTFTIEASQPRDGNQFSIGGDNSIRLINIALDVTNIIYPQLFMQDITQLNFLQSVLNAFNLVIYGDPIEYTTFHIESWEKYYKRGVAKEWTDKISVNEGLLVKPMTELQSRDLVLNFSDAEDTANKIYKSSRGYNFGTYNQRTGSAYAQDKVEVKPLFQPYMTSRTKQNEISQVARARYIGSNTDVSYVGMNMQLFYFDGRKSNANFLNMFYVYNWGDTSVILTGTYPFCFPYSLVFGAGGQFAVTEDSKQLNFGTAKMDTYPVAWEGAPLDNLYTDFFQEMFTEIYQPSNKILEANILLSPIEITNFEFNDIIDLDLGGTPEHWRVQKIIDYPTGKEGMAKIIMHKAYLREYVGEGELMRIKNVGGVIVDEVGNSTLVNNGLFAGTDAGVDAIRNLGDGWLDINGLSELDPHSEFTIACWVRIGGTARPFYILNKGSWSIDTERELLISITDAGLLSVNLINNEAGITSMNAYGNISNHTDRWLFIVASYDGSVDWNGLKLSYNNTYPSLQGRDGDYSKQAVGIAEYKANNAGDMINEASWWNDLRFWQRELVESEITELWNNEKGYYGL